MRNFIKHTIKILLGLTLLFCSLTRAEQTPPLTIASCEFQAHTARQVQTLRLTEGDDWSQFEQNVKKLYQDGQGRTDLLTVAEQVYLTPLNLSADEVYAEMLSACVELVNN
jgi:hypothetical protein